MWVSDGLVTEHFVHKFIMLPSETMDAKKCQLLSAGLMTHSSTLSDLFVIDVFPLRIPPENTKRFTVTAWVGIYLRSGIKITDPTQIFYAEPDHLFL